MFLVLYDLSKCVVWIYSIKTMQFETLWLGFLRSRWLQIQDALSLKDELSESWSVLIMLDQVEAGSNKLADTWNVSGCGGRCATDASLHWGEVLEGLGSLDLEFLHGFQLITNQSGKVKLAASKSQTVTDNSEVWGCQLHVLQCSESLWRCTGQPVCP